MLISNSNNAIQITPSMVAMLNGEKINEFLSCFCPGPPAYRRRLFDSFVTAEAAKASKLLEDARNDNELMPLLIKPLFSCELTEEALLSHVSQRLEFLCFSRLFDSTKSELASLLLMEDTKHPSIYNGEFVPWDNIDHVEMGTLIQWIGRVDWARTHLTRNTYHHVQWGFDPAVGHYLRRRFEWPYGWIRKALVTTKKIRPKRSSLSKAVSRYGKKIKAIDSNIAGEASGFGCPKILHRCLFSNRLEDSTDVLKEVANALAYLSCRHLHKN